jgi:hypothetical protein
MFDRPDGEWQIVHFADSSPSDERVHRLDRWSVHEFLRRFKSDHATMSDLRRTLYRFDPVSRYTNDEVIEGIVARLLAGQLRLRRQQQIRESSAGGGAGSGGGSQQSAAPASGPSPPTPQAQAPESSTFQNNDGDAQAAALAGAAASGVPFCEECSKHQ